MSTISAFPITGTKDSALAAASAFDPTDKFRIVSGGVSKTGTWALIKSQLAYQPYSGVLSTLASSTPSATGLGLLSLLVPDNVSYLRISSLGVPVFLTPTQLVADLLANGGGVDQTTTQSLYHKNVNGIQFVAGVSTSPDGTKTAIEIPSDSYVLRLIKVNYTGGNIDFQFTGPTVVTFPRTGVLATLFVREVSDDTKASTATVNLDTADGSQVDISGTTPITAFTLAENITRMVRFTGATTLVNSANLVLPGGSDITTAAGDYAVLIGGTGSVVRVLEYYRASANVFYGGDFRTGGAFKATGTTTIVGDFTTGGAVTVVGSAATVIRTPVAADVTLPAGTGTLATGIVNQDTTVRTITAATRTYISGSALTIPASKMKVGSRFSWKIHLAKTAAGTATSTFDICVGTAGTTSDTLVCSFTKPAGTAVADVGFVIIEAVVDAITAGTSMMTAEFVMMHNLASTGHMVIPTACVFNKSGGTDDFSVANLIVGVCITTGASDAITINQVTSTGSNI